MNNNASLQLTYISCIELLSNGTEAGVLMMYWIRRGGSFLLEPRCTNSECPDFHWGHIKSIFYKTISETNKHMVVRLLVAVQNRSNMPRMFANVQCHFELCIILVISISSPYCKKFDP
ncbi:hypothetical protein TNIN_272111 [Trichonephila inaurata madagascariensis]|uniref:Uncharacterized protein n=1 Tax=Trichonephila inaurata madagascariensis TaxID=2747483 RepID=A0A8X6I2H2_9ARAC|nr:hypothetical protein TNIN_272111 [Trichonephila inaurata madagascariensis]